MRSVRTISAVDTTSPVAEMAPAASRLEPNAISIVQDTLIGLADCGPTVTVSFALVLLIAATSYGAPLILAITAIPMLPPMLRTKLFMAAI